MLDLTTYTPKDGDRYYYIDVIDLKVCCAVYASIDRMARYNLLLGNCFPTVGDAIASPFNERIHKKWGYKHYHINTSQGSDQPADEPTMSPEALNDR